MLLTTLLAGFAHLLWCSAQYYYIIEEFKTWTEAQDYCRKYYYDLASFDNKEQHDLVVQTLVSRGYTDGVWIGLYDDRYSWRWSYGEEKVTYTNWALYQPDSYQSNEHCAVLLISGLWQDQPCEELFFFFCYNAKIKSTVLIKEKKSWSDALIYCRLYHTDLAIIENQEENKNLKQLLNNINNIVDRAYVGLYRDTWKWSDQSSYEFTNWMLGEPNNLNGGEYCGQLYMQYRQWSDEPCSVKRRFVCGSAKKIQVLRINIQPPPNLNVNDFNDTILQQFQQKLRKLGLQSNTKLTWRTQPDGQIFHVVNTTNTTNYLKCKTVK